MWIYSERNWLKSMFVALWLLIIGFSKKYSDILVYFVVELGDAFVCPVFSKLRQNMTQSIRPAGDTQWKPLMIQSQCEFTQCRVYIHSSIWPSIHHNVQWTSVVFTLWWCHLCLILWHDHPSSTGRWPPHSDRCLGTVWSHWTPPCWLRHAGLSASGYEKGQRQLK